MQIYCKYCGNYLNFLLVFYVNMFNVFFKHVTLYFDKYGCYDTKILDIMDIPRFSIPLNHNQNY